MPEALYWVYDNLQLQPFFRGFTLPPITTFVGLQLMLLF